jgi:hypothetical protein
MATSFDESYPFDSGDGSGSGENRWAVMGRFFRQTGVIPSAELADLSIANELEAYADGSGMNVKIKSGLAFVQGFIGRNNSTKTLSISTSDPTNDRIDLVVARLNRTGDDSIVEFDILIGTPGATPVAPTPTQSSATWEVELAEVNVTAAVTSIAASKVENIHKTSTFGGGDPVQVSANTTMKSGGAYIVNGNLDLTLPANAAPGDFLSVTNTESGSWEIKSNIDAMSQQIVLGLNESGTSYKNVIDMLRSNGQWAFVVLKCVVGGNNQVWVIENGDSYLMISSNYFGDGSDGDLVVSSNTNLSSTQDGDMVVKQYRSLTVQTGKTLSVANRCKGLLIYVQGNLTLSGTISMTGKGASVNPTTAGVSSSGIRLPMFKTGSTETLLAADFSGCGAAAIAAVANHQNIDANGKIYVIERTGNNGGSSVTGAGSTGSSGGNKSGGGGSGAGGGLGSGAGAAGTCFSGGAGGGAQYTDWLNSACNGVANGGAGGIGYLRGVYDGGVYSAGGGAGNPGGVAGNAAGQGYANDGEDGTGGVIIILVGGDVTIEATGIVEADGKNGGYESYYGGGGGASGGGASILLYSGSLTNSGVVRANGGTGGQNGSHGSVGGNGGAGLVVLEAVD